MSEVVPPNADGAGCSSSGAHERRQMHVCAVVVHLQKQPLLQPQKAIHNVACAPFNFQAITLQPAPIG